jgi:hypothetical protein
MISRSHASGIGCDASDSTVDFEERWPKTRGCFMSRSVFPFTIMLIWATRLAYAANETNPQCKEYNVPRIPMKDEPSDSERTAFETCDAEALYYAIGVKQDFERARKCAIVQRTSGNGPVMGGSGILMMIYANGKGVLRNLDLALSLACEIGDEVTDLDLRTKHLNSLRTRKKEIDLCDDITSGLMYGICRNHNERIVAAFRDARKRKAVAKLFSEELVTLEEKAQSYFESHTEDEVDHTGTERRVFEVAARAALEETYVADLEKLSRRQPPSRRPVEFAKAEAELDRVYKKVLEGPFSESVGAIYANGIRKTQQLWMAYRDAWILLTEKFQPRAMDLWRATLAKERAKTLLALGEEGIVLPSPR